MNRLVVILSLVLTVSCSVNKRSELESMNIKGKAKSVQEKFYNPNDSLIMTKYMLFNYKGNVKVVEHSFEHTDYRIKTESKYNLMGILQQLNYYRFDSLILTQEFLQVNDFLDSIYMYDPNGDLAGIGVMTYDENRNVIESKTFDKELNLIQSQIFEYDDYGKEINRVLIDKNTAPEKYKINYTYDNFGRVQFCETITFDSVVTIEEFQYTNDKNNNWIEKFVLDENGKIKQRIERVIHYK